MFIICDPLALTKPVLVAPFKLLNYLRFLSYLPLVSCEDCIYSGPDALSISESLKSLITWTLSFAPPPVRLLFPILLLAIIYRLRWPERNEPPPILSDSLVALIIALFMFALVAEEGTMPPELPKLLELYGRGSADNRSFRPEFLLAWLSSCGSSRSSSWETNDSWNSGLRR